nr:70 kDa peptidyl-prolyl isomerase-like [Quercus suber]POE78746.1 peptidyl-prolyl cis-trans isomerase fkbp65 [Quercus suber]
MVTEKATNVSEIEDDEDDEEPGEVIESAPPLKVGEERELSISGLKKKLLKLGRGWETPELGDEATVHYVGTLLDGTKFDSTRDRDHDESLTIKLGHGEVVSGLEHAIVTMKKGETALFTLPPELGYGVSGSHGVVQPNSVVQFEVELVSWITVVDVSRDGGIIKKIMVKGESNEQPGDLDQVLVKYRVALDDGTIVAETSEEGVEFYVKDGHLCPALQKAIMTMKRGEKAKLVVQPQYAFGEEGRDANNGVHSIPPGSILNIDVELVSFKPVIDITGDSKVLKKILKEGEGAVIPNEGATVTISYMARLEDGTIFEKKGIDGEQPLEFITDEEQVIAGLDQAVATMKKGERAILTIHPDFGFGSSEVRQDLAVIPPSSNVFYEVEMIDFTKEKAPWEMSNNEKIEAARMKKEEGNLLFKTGKYQRARKKYDKAADFVNEDGSFENDEQKLAEQLRVSCWLNGAACSLKLRDFQGAIKLCSEVLDIEFHNVKALYRQAQAYMETADLVSAELDIKKALEADPHNREVKLIQKNLKQLQAESDKRESKLYMNMFAHKTRDTPVATKKLKVEKAGDDKTDEEVVGMKMEKVADSSAHS